MAAVSKPMTVKQLQKELNKYPLEFPVVLKFSQAKCRRVGSIYIDLIRKADGKSISRSEMRVTGYEDTVVVHAALPKRKTKSKKT